MTQAANQKILSHKSRVLSILLSLVTLTLLSLHIHAEYSESIVAICIFKPLTTLSIIVLALIGLKQQPSFYKKAILAGLLFSLAGDVFLIFPSNYLMEGLISFLFTHFCYMAAFKSEFRLRLYPIFSLLLLGFSTTIFFILRPSLGEMQWPVLLYILSLSTMVYLSYGRWKSKRKLSALLTLAGALLFMSSDLSLAIRLFRGDYSGAVLLIFITYFAAQYLIALSTHPWTNTQSLESTNPLA